MRRVFVALVVSAIGAVASAFVAPYRASSLQNVVSLRVTGKDAPESQAEERKGQISFQGLMELVTLGLGAPNLGKFKGVNEETGTLEFELESNRFIANDGKEYNSLDNSKGTYFEDGLVDESADVMKQLSSFFGGGKKKTDQGDDTR